MSLLYFSVIWERASFIDMTSGLVQPSRLELSFTADTNARLKQSGKKR